MGKIRLKRRFNLNKKRFLFFIILFLIISILSIVSYVNDKITPVIVEISKIEIDKISTLVINSSINQVLNDKSLEEKIISLELSENGEIQSVDFNSLVVNKILNLVTINVQNNLRLLEEGEIDKIGIQNVAFTQNKREKLKKGIVAEIPIGVIFKNSLLSNLGPTIPIRFHYFGNVNSSAVTNIRPYGINNALVEIGIKMNINIQIILPFIMDQINLDYYMPISIRIIQGKVPNYYSGSMSEDSQIYSLPF